MAKKVARKASVKKSVKKKVVQAAKAKAVAKRPAKKVAVKAAKRVAAPKPKVVAGESLGRPLVTAEEKLYMLFKEDYHARQIFEFLRVQTVGELEQFSPQQIIEILSRPVRQTVDRIRERLADQKRALRDDTEFAVAHRKSHPSE